jgi:hypothetical protein
MKKIAVAAALGTVVLGFSACSSTTAGPHSISYNQACDDANHAFNAAANGDVRSPSGRYTQAEVQMMGTQPGGESA